MTVRYEDVLPREMMLTLTLRNPLCLVSGGEEMAHKVKEVAALTGISVRTLHHYDEIGLLKPHTVTDAGYRLYSEEDLERLQQILFFKELDFGLDRIRDILDSPGFDRRQALEAQLDLLGQKKNRLERIMKTVEQTLKTIEGGSKMSKQDMFGAFDMSEIKKHQEQYAEEARQKYGEKARETEKRTAGYTEKDWAAIQAEAGAIYQKFIQAMDKGAADPLAQEAADEWRAHITKHYYDCTLEIFRGLGEMYVADERFTANIDRFQSGLAAFMKEAMQRYCDRAEGIGS